MEGLKLKQRSVVLMAVLVCVGLVTEEAMAAQYEVVWDQSTDYNAWASGKSFKVGDQIVFKYSPGLHSVVELADETAYKKCDIGSPLTSMNAGNDAVKLSKSGDHYFACGTPGHCGQGMKLKITTASADSSPKSSSKSPSSTSASNSSPAAASSAFAVFPSSTAVLMVVVSAICLVFLP
ncbi:mavicyanin [Malania oleifera]|uniref:mavicyanin n=1 Tax=Malania oleifera TaxID=397392 RepID=UPI0025ADEC1E|nr:mavicyanin [Malania oleifera]